MATIPNGAPDSLALIPEVSATTSAPIPLEHPKMNPGLSLVAPNNRADSERRWWQVSGSNTGFLPIATDLLLAALSASIIFHISAGSSGIRFSLTNQLRALLMLYAALTILSAHSLGLYRLRRWNTGETLAIAKSVGLASILFAAFVLLAGQPLSLAAIGCMGAMNVGAFAAWRAWDRHTASHRIEAGKMRNVLIVGASASGTALERSISANPHWGFVVRGFLDDRAHSNGIRVAGTVAQLADIARAEYIDDIFIAPPYDGALVWKLTEQARLNHWNVKVLPEFWQPAMVQPQVELLGELPVFSLHREPIPAVALCMKRTLDVVLSICAAPIVIPLIAALALLVKLDSPGPAFYRANRIGRKGRKFCCWKLRTMISNADAMKEELRAANQRSGPFFKLSFDPRITRIGRLLRRSSLDELPQLWNVFRGDMSLVGPRPHPIDDYERYDLEHRRRLQVRPGITGLWQVKARRDPSFDINMALDLTYIENWSLWLDCKILLQTIPVVLKGTGQ
ncbi:MAG: sugar transferase [Acidobacteria bacterium]|nr:MAG: sugar transferase [Acidobacteriota bacterium]PYY23311.1 MAG: sugar transferase [Acidobacteriota bacterium]